MNNIKALKHYIITNTHNFNNFNLTKYYFNNIKTDDSIYSIGDFIKINFITLNNKKYLIKYFEGIIIKKYKNKFYNYICMNLIVKKQIYSKLLININSPKILNIQKIK